MHSWSGEVHVDGTFHTKLEHDDRAWTLACGGELDLAAVLRLEEAFDLCADLRPASLHVDARDVSFIDSAGISALMRCAHRCNEQEIAFSLEVSDQVHATLIKAGVVIERLLLGKTPTPIA